MVKALSRATSDAKIAGVCGGIADYYQLSRNGLRLAALLALFAFPMVIACTYILLAVILPSGQR